MWAGSEPSALGLSCCSTREQMEKGWDGATSMTCMTSANGDRKEWGCKIVISPVKFRHERARSTKAHFLWVVDYLAEVWETFLGTHCKPQGSQEPLHPALPSALLWEGHSTQSQLHLLGNTECSPPRDTAALSGLPLYPAVLIFWCGFVHSYAHISQ